MTTSMVRFDPWGLVRDLDRLFEEGARRSGESWTPRVNVFERDANLVVQAEVPGVDPADIEVTIEGATLMIAGSRRLENEESTGTYHRRELFEGSFKRTILLPEGTNPEAITAGSHDGILEVTIPKRPEVLPRKVSVDVQR
jgi:HSP20 family protein